MTLPSLSNVFSAMPPSNSSTFTLTLLLGSVSSADVGVIAECILKRVNEISHCLYMLLNSPTVSSRKRGFARLLFLFYRGLSTFQLSLSCTAGHCDRPQSRAGSLYLTRLLHCTVLYRNEFDSQSQSSILANITLITVNIYKIIGNVI